MYSHSTRDVFSQNQQQQPMMSQYQGNFGPQVQNSHRDSANSNYLETMNSENETYTPIDMGDYGVDIPDTPSKQQSPQNIVIQDIEQNHPDLYVGGQSCNDKCCTTDTPVYFVAVALLILAFAIMFAFKK